MLFVSIAQIAQLMNSVIFFCLAWPLLLKLLLFILAFPACSSYIMATNLITYKRIKLVLVIKHLSLNQ